jgi:hypothetical protein
MCPSPFAGPILGRTVINVLNRRYLVTELDIAKGSALALLMDSYGLDSFELQAAVILHLRSLNLLKLCSVVFSGRKSLHALWQARDENTNREFFSQAVALGVDRAHWTLNQGMRIYNPGKGQFLVYLNPD